MCVRERDRERVREREREREQTALDKCQSLADVIIGKKVTVTKQHRLCI